MFDKQIFLITGGTGSFGNAVLKRFLGTNIAEIRVFSRDEKKQDDMRHEYRSDKLKFYIGDVRNPDSILPAMPLRPGSALLKNLEGKDYEVYAIGDCREPGWIVDAIAEGSRLARSI